MKLGILEAIDFLFSVAIPCASPVFIVDWILSFSLLFLEARELRTLLRWLDLRELIFYN